MFDKMEKIKYNRKVTGTDSRVPGAKAPGAPKRERCDSMSIQVGFGRQVMTPDFPCWLAGGGYPKRIHTNVLEDVFAHCVAITDEKGVTALIFALDM